MEAGTCDHLWSPSRTQDGWRARLWKAIRTRAYGVFDDETLVRRASAKDHIAFAALMARYRDRLYTLALTSLRNEDEAHDALCEMVLSAFKDINSFGSKCAPGTWLYLHGLRAVFKRLNAPPGTYVVERPCAAGVASRGLNERQSR